MARHANDFREDRHVDSFMATCRRPNSMQTLGPPGITRDHAKTTSHHAKTCKQLSCMSCWRHIPCRFSGTIWDHTKIKRRHSRSRYDKQSISEGLPLNNTLHEPLAPLLTKTRAGAADMGTHVHADLGNHFRSREELLEGHALPLPRPHDSMQIWDHLGSRQDHAKTTSHHGKTCKRFS
jgi:hypothetical protein